MGEEEDEEEDEDEDEEEEEEYPSVSQLVPRYPKAQSQLNWSI